MDKADALSPHDVNSLCESSVAKVADGDIGGLTILYSALKKPVFLLAYSILGDYALAEDVMQDTFLRVNEKAATYRKGTSPKAWILSVARSIALNTRKSRSREEVCEETPENGNTESIESKAVLNADFTRALTCLDEDERNIIILKVGADLRHAEIAKILEISTGDARVRYCRALKKLKKYYSESDKE